MPRFAEYIRADKSGLKFSDWKSGHITPRAFPMTGAKAKAYKFGPSYSWRVASFTCLSHECRVLILLNEEKQILRASFAVERNGGTVLAGVHEFHADHPGWHCHSHISDIDALPAGVNREGMRRWPGKRSHHGKTVFGVSKAAALTHVAKVFRLWEDDDGLI